MKKIVMDDSAAKRIQTRMSPLQKGILTRIYTNYHEISPLVARDISCKFVTIRVQKSLFAAEASWSAPTR